MDNLDSGFKLKDFILSAATNSGLSWSEIIGEVWKIGKKVMRGFSNEGMYEVFDYESILELKDKRGEKASVQKYEKVRYLQDNILTYQDQAWGDGEILINYQSTPGTPVDRYRSGYKTHVLISLREIKNKNDVDEFNIKWGIHRGFLKKTGFWATEISHKTKQVKVQVIFPKVRPPLRASIAERNLKKNYLLDKDAKIQLPDGRWQLTWEKDKPRLYEQFILTWDW